MGGEAKRGTDGQIDLGCVLVAYGCSAVDSAQFDMRRRPARQRVRPTSKLGDDSQAGLPGARYLCGHRLVSSRHVAHTLLSQCHEGGCLSPWRVPNDGGRRTGAARLLQASGGGRWQSAAVSRNAYGKCC